MVSLSQIAFSIPVTWFNYSENVLVELAHDTHAVVSSDSDLLILVNSNDEELGSADKLVCHDGDGVLHRAFSVLLFNADGELLVQKRAPGKRLWGGYWSNSCCSHPRKGETMGQACERRMLEELGVRGDLEFQYKFEYHAKFDDEGAEHELCWVYVGRCEGTPSVNVNEISEWRFVAADQLEKELNEQPKAFTPWFKLEWETLKKNHREKLASLGVLSMQG